MTTKLTIQTRRITAIMLLLLFTGILLVKIFHHHDLTGKCDYVLVKEVDGSGYNGCTVCQFHFAEDLDGVPMPFSFSLDISSTPTTGSFYVSSTPQDTSALSDPRGPPIICSSFAFSLL